MAKRVSKPHPQPVAAHETHEWRGASGKLYKYYISRISNTFKDVPGNYIYAMPGSDGGWKALFIGQTASLSRRPEGSCNGERAAVGSGATYIHAHISGSNEAERQAELSDLIQSLHPRFNEEAVSA